MAERLWIAGNRFESLVEKIKMIGENWTKQDKIDEIFIPY
jgi:hypothetical protein